MFIIDTQFSRTAAQVLMDRGYSLDVDVLESNVYRGCVLGIQNDNIAKPHFQLVVGSYNITFDIETGKRLENEHEFEIFDNLMCVYWDLDRLDIADCWNRIRPERWAIPSDWKNHSTNTKSVVRGIERLYVANLPLRNTL